MNDDKYIKKAMDNVLNNVKAVFHKDTFLCGVFLLKYINDKDEKAYENFLSIFKKLTLEEMIQVLSNVKANLSQRDKIKTKK